MAPRAEIYDGKIRQQTAIKVTRKRKPGRASHRSALHIEQIRGLRPTARVPHSQNDADPPPNTANSRFPVNSWRAILSSAAPIRSDAISVSRVRPRVPEEGWTRWRKRPEATNVTAPSRSGEPGRSSPLICWRNGTTLTPQCPSCPDIAVPTRADVPCPSAPALLCARLQARHQRSRTSNHLVFAKFGG